MTEEQFAKMVRALEGRYPKLKGGGVEFSTVIFYKPEIKVWYNYGMGNLNVIAYGIEEINLEQAFEELISGLEMCLLILGRMIVYNSSLEQLNEALKGLEREGVEV